MSLTRTESKDLVVPLAEYNWGPCSPATLEGSRTVKFTTEWYNSTISRTRPPDPLWNYPTSLPQQSTGVQVYGKSKTKIYQGQKACAGYPGSFPKWTTYHYYDGCDTSLRGTEPDPNWELAIRSAIEETYTNLGEALVEYRETAGMFPSLASQSWKAYKALRRGDLKTLTRKWHWCDVPAAELTTSFGVLPLAQVAYESGQRLLGKLEVPLIRRISAIAVEESRGYTTLPSYNLDWRWKTSAKAIYYVRFKTDNSGFYIPNPVALGWAAVPFSFVIDWQIPIGDWLQSLDALKGIEWAKGTVTTRSKYHSKKLGGAMGQEIEWTPKYHWRSHRRDVPPEIGIPAFPKYNPSASWKRLMHGLSLLGAMSKPCRKIQRQR